MFESQFSGEHNEMKKWESMFEEQRKLTEDEKQQIEILNQQMKRKEADYQQRIDELDQLLNMTKVENQNRIDELYRLIKNKEEEDQNRIENDNLQLGVQMKKFYELLNSHYEYKRIGQWKSNQAPDFESDIFLAASNGKLTSIIYLLAN